MASVRIVERSPSVEEYCRLVAAVGWKPRDLEAISRALAGSLFAVCAEADGHVIAMGRVIGDGGLHYYLTDVVVVPAHQHQGVGSRIVAALTKYVESVPFKNTWVGLFAVEGTAEFYSRFGYTAQRASGPAMYRWLNQPFSSG
jgi:GNAT superfamily N-acetyltransferase